MKRLQFPVEAGGRRAETAGNDWLNRARNLARLFIAFVLVVCSPTLPCLADGKVFPPVAFPASVTIPDQRALIHFTNGVERLVIETRFTGAGTNFAWVVPLPAQPVIEEATTGLFPTLDYLFRPEILHNVTRYYVGILIGVGVVCLLCYAARSVLLLLATIFVLALLVSMLFPALGTSKAAASTASASAVTIMDRRLVGVFDTTTISSRDPLALQAWLRENGFSVPTNSEPVIADYVRDGWVFVTAKVNRDQADAQTSTAHPLSFTFPTAKPVYPMRLTGLDNGPLRVELYVFAPGRAEARHFQVERCTRPAYPEPPKPSRYGPSWGRWSPDTLIVVHPLLRQWVEGTAVATKLTATLTPDQMREDVWLRASHYQEKRNRLYSETAAMTMALNWGSGVFAVGLLAAYGLFFARAGQRARFGPTVGLAAIAGLVLTGLVYLILPTAEVRLVKRPFSGAQHVLRYLAMELWDDQPRTREEVRRELRQLLATPSEEHPGVRLAQHFGGTGWANLLLGGSIREEDSPGNFTVRENGDELEFLGYDALGTPHVLGSWTSRREP